MRRARPRGAPRGRPRQGTALSLSSLRSFAIRYQARRTHITASGPNRNPRRPRLKEWVGKEVAVTDWLAVSQERIDAFAGATGDHQWIHVDRERAAKESPYGTTVAHGFLTLALLPHL